MLKFCNILALSLLILVSACSDKKKSEQISSNEIVIVAPDSSEVRNTYKIDVADTQEKMYHGLMGRTSIDENYGLLFDISLAPKDAEIAFWMKDTLIPLDFVFVDDNGIVFYIYEDAQPNDLSTIRSPKRPRIVLEINSGQVQKHNIQVGDVFKTDILGNK
ncbi:MAG: DUF192 domain-containing protein [Alphaproteobacteria bacterium]|nr:DUF192 domain-containing protein [Alphaproteobacteria bacterium]